MEILQDKINILTSDDNKRYFYHFTPVDANKILEEGLIVSSKNWEESFLEFTKEELENIDSVINDNRNTKIKKNNFMIIVAVQKENVNKFISTLDYNYYVEEWEGIGNPDYIVDNNYIVGYIDLNELELYINEYSDMLSNAIYL